MKLTCSAHGRIEEWGTRWYQVPEDPTQQV